MALYPSLEDMKVDQLMRAQMETFNPPAPLTQYPNNPSTAPEFTPTTPEMTPGTPSAPGPVYPSLGEYMGLELSQAVIAQNMPHYLPALIPSTQYDKQLIAPISGQSLGLQKAQVSHGVRQVILCKDKDNKVGLRVKAINTGIFVCLVIDKSPAALAGLRFGDQILQINGENVAGYSMEKVHNLFKKSPVNGINVAVRDRPFERTITLHKDSLGSIGFQFKNGKITTIIKDSSAARNGVLTDHNLLEIEGQNVVGLKDKQIGKIIEQAGDVVTITVVPSFIYEHIVNKMSGSLLKDLMDHSIPSF